jgi:thiamine biosynthesis protein ThiS
LTVVVNGEQRRVAAGATVAQVLADIGPGLDRRGVAVSVNGEVVPRSGWVQATLEEGDRVEILGAIQGG